MMRLCVCLLSIVLLSAGCATGPRGPYSSLPEGSRNTHKAEKLNREAADLLKSDPEKAEALLREALTEDLYFGPAHNNLGVVYLGQDKLYEAAGEFEWARRVMPGHPDPRLNLALTLEEAGRFEEAMQSYESALAVHPDHVRSMQGLTRLQIRHGRTDERTGELLQKVALRGETRQWREWARMQETLLGR